MSEKKSRSKESRRAKKLLIATRAAYLIVSRFYRRLLGRGAYIFSLIYLYESTLCTVTRYGGLVSFTSVCTRRFLDISGDAVVTNEFRSLPFHLPKAFHSVSQRAGAEKRQIATRRLRGESETSKGQGTSFRNRASSEKKIE